MSKKHKIYTALGVAVYAVVIVLHIIDGNFSAVCGWICTAIWFAIARWHEDRAERYRELWKREFTEYNELFKKNTELRCEIARLKTEDVDDGK